VRLNISVPDDLAEQVRAHDLPISAICQTALRSEVELAKKKEQIMTDLDVVVDRLRGTQDEARKRHYDEGRALGVLWAKTWATFDDLKRVAEGDLDNFIRFDTGNDSMLEFYDSLDDHGMESAYADDHNLGFIAGAAEVWDAVKHRL
jgi:hypothetical protein